MKHTRLFLLIFLFPLLASAQSPTLTDSDDVAMEVSEYYNMPRSSAVDKSSCNGTAGSRSTTNKAGSITPTVSGDLLWQWAVNAGTGGSAPNSVRSFTTESQRSIAWQFNGADIAKHQKLEKYE